MATATKTPVKSWGFYLDGKWHSEGERFEVLAPYDHAVVGSSYRATAAHAEEAVRAAQRAFQITRKMPGYERQAILRAICDGISKRREDFNELMAMVVNSIPDGVHSVDVAGRVTAINLAARKMYGYAELEILGLANEILLPAGRRDETRRMHDRALGGEIIPRFPTWQVRSDGAEIPVSMTIVPMRQGERPISNVAFIATALGNVTRDLGIPSARHESHPPRHAPVMSVH